MYFVIYHWQKGQLQPSQPKAVKESTKPMISEGVLFTQLSARKYILNVEKFCNPKYIELAQSTQDKDVSSTDTSRSTLRSISISFEYKTYCLFCGTADRSQTIVFQERIKQACLSRNDSWSETVLSRIEYVQDLFAADAVYRSQCIINFRFHTSFFVMKPHLTND